MEPLGESLPNQEIFRRLAKVMNYDAKELFASDRALLDSLLQKSGVGLDFAALAQRGTIDWIPRLFANSPALSPTRVVPLEHAVCRLVDPL